MNSTKTRHNRDRRLIINAKIMHQLEMIFRGVFISTIFAYVLRISMLAVSLSLHLYRACI